uniref:Leucine-rich immune protein (Short) n=1 Tax=Anopheles stephensi TaxID=30069 RepID=A0A182XYU5_ANOST
MKHSGPMLLVALFLGSVWVAASASSTSAVECTKPRGTVCIIQALPASKSNDKTAVQFPDLSRRKVLKVLEGTLSNLSEPIALTLTVRILWMEELGMENAFVAPGFEELHLRANRLTTLETKSGSSFALKLLDVRQNRLKSAAQLEPFVQLEELHLDDNHLEQLDMSVFARMPNLRVLSAAGNGLTRIVPPISMLVLNELVTLSLGHNRLSSMEMKHLQLPSLRTLRLSNNSLEELAGLDGFEQFFDLQKMELAGNRWSCGWLLHALGNITVRRPSSDATASAGVTLDADANCSIEKVHGICCSITPMAGQPEGHLFVQEIGQVRVAIEQIDRRHEAFLRARTDTLNELKKTLQTQLDDLQSFFADQENESERAAVRATQIVQKERQLRDRYVTVSSATGDAERIEQERKRLLHFMVDMKNRLLRQAIETDSLWVQANAEKANIERLFEERPHPTPRPNVESFQ